MGGVCGKVNAVQDSDAASGGQTAASRPTVCATEQEYSSNTKVDERIIQILQQKKRENDAGKPKFKNFDQIILKFGRIEKAFMSLKSLYEEFKDVRTLNSTF